MAESKIPNLIAVVTDDDSCSAVNPELITRVSPRSLGGSVIHFRDGSFMAVQEDFEELTGIDPEAAVEEAKEAREEKAKEKAAVEAEAEAKAKEAEKAAA